MDDHRSDKIIAPGVKDDHRSDKIIVTGVTDDHRSDVTYRSDITGTTTQVKQDIAGAHSTDGIDVTYGWTWSGLLAADGLL
ncbi:hypothetical protein scyTo_0001346 [Scyliorhinus torazame]|uniref:Uncharacterized protein n=1 Tax=Scyliorhinus torazame TaxID=75743 RepID=A0A401PC58_SCYTO|nr:hypothetical protein [Scyliorhinus torazame]